ncbi:low temperature requirement protein A [Nocardia jiangxiensis]|uniref:Low temperature requirement protein A n=1 Tax=Nocardia jiangxiensis TaxID=282685 RepID=A0ABW6S4W4_9NOCA|nr:low temperature requirement protein A [Nocardia jiangxiensis]
MTSETPDVTAQDEVQGGQVRASTLELFFDLVFVFTITQLTHVFGEHPGLPALGRVALMFGVIWWMYSGYVFLTNEVAPSSTMRRTWLLVGMFGFFVVALAVPSAFGGTGVAFGAGYFLVNSVHTALFYANGGSTVTRAVIHLAPLNLTSAGLVLAGGFVHGWPRYLLWCAALAVQIVTPYLSDTGGFVVRSAHFAERHGLVVIVAIGESIVAIGAALAGEDITVGLILTVALGLALAYVLWWAYFGLDDERGEAALSAVPGPRRARYALLAYGYSLFPLLIGIIVAAAGIRLCIVHGDRAVSWSAALALSGGVALYFFGQFCFRLVLGLPWPWSRLIAAPVVLATAPLGVVWVAWGQLAILLVVAFGFVIADDYLSLRSGATSAYLTPAGAVLRVTRRRP